MAVHADMAAAQFENVNELRRYPFTEDASLADLLLGTITDVGIVVPADVPVNGGVFKSFDPVPAPVVEMTSVHLSPSMVSVCFRSVFDGKTSALSVTVSSATFRPYFPYRLEKLFGSDDIGGFVSFGDIRFPDNPETYRFDGATVHPSCVAMAKPAGLRRITDRRSGTSISGDVRISFSGYVDVQSDAGDPKSVSLSLAEGAETELASDCIDMSGSNPCGATPIRSINGVQPDEEGNIVLWFH